MMKTQSPIKKQRFEFSAVEKSTVETARTSTTKEISLAALCAWLVTSGTQGLENDKLLFRASETCGNTLGCFAVKSFLKGEVLFRIPRALLLSYSDVRNSPLCAQILEVCKDLLSSSSITQELLLWIEMCRERADAGAPRHTYFASLSDIPPGAAYWPLELKQAFVGTNLQFLAEDISDLNRFTTVLGCIRERLGSQLFPDDVYSIQNILWARGHYLSRRYPEDFAYSVQQQDRQSIFCTIAKETGLQENGAMVPLLDLLNHKTVDGIGNEWLDFQVDEKYLTVSTNIDIHSGSEIFSNYGSKPNEALLYAYGFCPQHNPYDAFTVKLSANYLGQKLDLGTFYIENGGFDNIPKELWKAMKFGIEKVENSQDETNPDSDDEISVDDIEELIRFLMNKKTVLDKSEESYARQMMSLTDKNNEITGSSDIRIDFLEWYRTGQKRILSGIIESLEQVLSEFDEDDRDRDYVLDGDDDDHDRDYVVTTDGDDE